MNDENKHNILYFEDATMKGLFETMQQWQETNQKRFLSTNIQRDNDRFCCIALTNPTEVVICDGGGLFGTQANVSNGNLNVVVK